MGFSWKIAKERAIIDEIEYCKTQCRGKTPNTDMKMKHPDWVRDAQTKNWAQLEKQVREYMVKRQNDVMIHRKKLA